MLLVVDYRAIGLMLEVLQIKHALAGLGCIGSTKLDRATVQGFGTIFIYENFSLGQPSTNV